MLTKAASDTVRRGKRDSSDCEWHRDEVGDRTSSQIGHHRDRAGHENAHDCDAHGVLFIALLILP
jgi:hypothetical protein